MTSFIVETYSPRLGEDGLARVIERAREAAATTGGGGSSVRHVRSYLVPGDEMCFHVFEGPSPEAVTRVAELAGIDAERVVEAVGNRPEVK